MIDTPEHPPTNEEMGSSEELDASDIEQTELQGETPPGEPSTDDASSSLSLEQRGSFLGRFSNRVQHYWAEHKAEIIISIIVVAAGALACRFGMNSESDCSEYEDAESSDDDSIDDDSNLFSTEDDVSSEISDSDEQIRRKSPREHTVNGYTRNQPYGPGRSLRRPQEIDSYQRGGEREN